MDAIYSLKVELHRVLRLLRWIREAPGYARPQPEATDYDLFPDADRTLPFGSGATFYWNYLDLQVRNPYPFPIRLHLKLTDTHLVGEVYAPRPLPYEVRVMETDHRFYREGGVVWRENRLWREALEPGSARLLWRELVAENRCRVLYAVPDALLADERAVPREQELA